MNTLTPDETLIDKKVALIHDINIIQMALGKPAIEPEQFNDLYDSPLYFLQEYVNDQASLLSRVKERNLLY